MNSMNVTRRTTIPHREGCCGCLDVGIEDGYGVIFCNECGEVVEALVPIEELNAALRDLSKTEQVCSEACPKCGSLNVFPGMSAIIAYTCRACGQGVSVGTTVQ